MSFYLSFLILQKSFIKTTNIKDQICCTDRFHLIVSRVKKMKFLPANTTSHLQLSDQKGIYIMRNIYCNFRGFYLDRFCVLLFFTHFIFNCNNLQTMKLLNLDAYITVTRRVPLVSRNCLHFLCT
jgi:hypothetical protein